MTPTSSNFRPLTVVSPIHKAQRQLSLCLSERSVALGLPGQEGHVLSFVAHYGPCSVGELGRVFGYPPSTLTGVLDRLERTALLSRRIHPSDRRSFLVEATAEGRRLGVEARRMVEDFEAEVLARVDDGDLQGFRAVLAAVAEVAAVAVHPREAEQTKGLTR